MKFRVSIIVSLIFLGFGCQKSENLSPEPLSFALKEGDEAIYEVTETTYAINDEPNTSTYFLRDVTVEAISEGVNKSYKVERYRRNNSSETWRIIRVINFFQTPAELIETGEKTLVKLNFPIVENSTFNVNRYNNSGILTATYRAVQMPFGEFPLTFSVIQASDSTLINLNREIEVYAPETGMVYKENTNYDYCQSSPACIGKGQVSFGRSTVWRRVN